MNKIFAVFLLPLLLTTAAAQNNQSKSDDFGRISLRPMLDGSCSSMEGPSQKLFLSKLSQIATVSGLGSSGSSQFYIAAMYNILNKEVIAGAPVQIVIEAEVVVMIGDLISESVFGTSTFVVKGIGVNEQKAVSSVLKNITPSSPQCRKLVETAKEKILEYYNSQCDFILRKAQSMAETNQYEKGIFILLNIPEVSKDCYFEAQRVLKPMYKAYIDKRCPELLSMARNAWIKDQGYAGAENATIYLNQIDPDAACYPQAQLLVTEMADKIKTLENRSWDFTLRQFKEGVAIEKQRIEAMRQIGVAYGENQQPTTINLNSVKNNNF